MKHYLLVANQTASSRTLKRAVKHLMHSGPCAFSLVVPATHPSDQLTWTEGEAQELAKDRLCEALDRLRITGALVTGWVGDEDPYLAVADALREETYDAVVLSTLTKTLSRWLGMDVASRVERDFDVPVHVVESETFETTEVS